MATKLLDPAMDFEWVRDAGEFVIFPAEKFSKEDHWPGVNGDYLVEMPRDIHIAQRYTPLRDYSGLFLTFAHAEPTNEGVRDFASQYGALGGRIPDDMHPDEVLNYYATELATEPVQFWIDEIRKMKQAVDIWDAVREATRGDERTQLEEIIINASLAPDSFTAKENSDEKGVTYVLSGPQDLDRFWGDRMTKCALLLLDRLLRTSMTRGNFVPTIAPARERKAFDLGIKPINLLGAIWLQFARSLDVKKKYHPCDECKTWFEVHPKARHRDINYCSNRCRVSAYRERREKREAAD